MTNLRINLVVWMCFLVTIFVSSCNKDNTLIPKNAGLEQTLESQNPPKAAKQLSFNEVAQISRNFTNDYASFSDFNQYSNFINSYWALTDNEKEEIIKSIQFETVDQHLGTLLAEIDNFNSREEIISYIQENEKHLKLSMDSEGNEQIVSNNLSLYHGKPFFNSNQIVRVGDEYIKYVDNVCVLSTNLNSLERIATKEDAITSNLKLLTVAKILTTSGEELEYGSRWGDENNPYLWTATYNPKWCKKDRRAKLELNFVGDIDRYNDPIFGIIDIHTVSRYANLKAQKKGIPCIWYGYSTKMTWNNFHFEYDISLNGTTTSQTIWKESNLTKTTRNITRRKTIQTYVSNLQNYDFQWTKKRTSATLAVLNGKWIEIDE